MYICSVATDMYTVKLHPGYIRNLAPELYVSIMAPSIYCFMAPELYMYYGDRCSICCNVASVYTENRIYTR